MYMVSFCQILIKPTIAGVLTFLLSKSNISSLLPEPALPGAENWQSGDISPSSGISYTIGISNVCK